MRLQDCQNYFDAVLSASAADGPSRAEAEAAARALVVPIRLGGDGQTNSGKSHLLNVLVDGVGVFPSKYLPLTGNLTVGRLVLATPGQRLGATGWRLKFLTAEAVGDLFATTKAAILEAARLRSVRPATSELLAAFSIDRGWAAVATDVEAAWSATGAVELRPILTELYRLARAMTYGAPLLGQTVTTDAAVVREAVVLPGSGTHLARTGDELRDEWTAARAAAGPLPLPPSASLTPPVASLLFPLIARAEIDIAVADESWGGLLDELGPVPFEMYDLPGRAPGTWAVRNQFVRDRAATEIGAFLAVQDGASPQEGELVAGGAFGSSDRFSTADRTFAVLNRFDKFPLAHDDQEAALDRLIAPDRTTVREREALAALTSLEPMVLTLRHLANPALPHAAITSSMLGLHALAAEGRLTPDAADTKAVEEAAVFAKLADNVLPKWRRLAELIQATEANSPLARWLHEYVSPGQPVPGKGTACSSGGIRAVRLRLQDFIRKTMVGRRYNSALDSARKLNRRQTEGEAARAVRPAPTASVEAADALREHLTRFIDEVRKEKSAFPTALTVSSVAALPPGGPSALVPAPIENPTAVRDIVLEETIHLFWHDRMHRSPEIQNDWSWKAVWEGLLRRVEPNGYVRPLGQGDAHGRTPLPQWTDDLLDPFCTACGRVLDLTDRLIRLALADWVGEFRLAVQKHVGSLSQLLQSPFIMDHLGEPDRSAVGYLSELARGNEKPLLAALTARLASEPKPVPADAFPLAQPTQRGAGPTGRALAWAAARAAPDQQRWRHQLAIARLREELTGAAQGLALRTLSAARDTAKRWFDGELEAACDGLRNLIADDIYWAELARSLEAAPVAAADSTDFPRFNDYFPEENA